MRSLEATGHSVFVRPSQTLFLVLRIMLASRIAIAAAQNVVYPADAGVIDVTAKKYGAKGDGKTDDSDAILAAIQDYVGEFRYGILYFPNGTYMVSKQLIYLTKGGDWGAYLTLQGQSEANTTIRLIDNAPGFQSATSPRAVIFTASNSGNVLPNSPLYNPNGSGNEGFRNHIMNLTIDTGNGNPGAIGIDYMANNNTRISDVSIVSEDGAGAVGINIQRGFPGPMLLKDISITGLATGIAVSGSNGVWIEHLKLAKQLVSGVDVNNGSVSIRDFQSSNSVPAVRMPSWQGVLSLTSAALLGGSASSSAIELGGTSSSQPTLFLSDASSAGYKSLVSQSGQVRALSPQGTWTSTPASHLFPYTDAPSITVQETPYYNDTNFANWGNVVSYGALPNNPSVIHYTLDSSDAIQAAFDSGKTTVYLPPGAYAISKTIHVRGALKRILLLQANLIPLNNQFPAGQPALQVDNGSADTVFIENLILTQNDWVLNSPDIASFPEPNFVNNSPRTLVLTNSEQTGYANTTAANGGTVFLESVFGQTGMRFSGQNIYARNLDPENWDTNPHVQVSGGSLWDLGLKVEGPNSPVLVNSEGAKTMVLGLVGCVFVDVPASIPMIQNLDSSLLVSTFRSNAYSEPGGASDYDVLVDEMFGPITKDLYRAGSGLEPTVPFWGAGSVGSLFADAPQ